MTGLRKLLSLAELYIYWLTCLANGLNGLQLTLFIMTYCDGNDFSNSGDLLSMDELLTCDD